MVRASMLIGSADGVMTATRTAMPTMAKRRDAGELSGSRRPSSSRKISTIGNWKPIPKANIM